MRQLKFRAWNKQKEIMNYDNEDDTEDYWDGIYTSDIGMVNRLLNIPDKDDYDSISSFRNKYEVLEYTGLKDKNGVEIYEGDIVQFSDWPNKVIAYKDVYFAGFSLKGTDLFLSGFDAQRMKVIGNIYENPELLEEGTE